MKNKKVNLLVLFVFGILTGSILISNFSSIIPVKAGWDPVTLDNSENVKFPDINHATLQYTIKTTAWYGDNPEIHYSVDEFRTDIYGRYFYIWVDDVKVLDTTIYDDKSGIVSTSLLKGEGLHTIKIEIYSGSYGDGCYKLNYLKIAKLFWTQSSINKYAYIFYQHYDKWHRSDYGVVSDGRVDAYCDILEDFGFTTYPYKDPDNWITRMNELDALENENDIVFIWIPGHGFYAEGADVSSIRVNQGGTSDYVQSDIFENYVDNLESKRIFVMVDACECGDFRDKLDIDGVSVITSNDESHDSIYYALYGIDYAYPKFSNKFFNKIGDTGSDGGATVIYDDLNSFRFVRDYFSWSYGLSNFEAWHSFFGP